MKHVAVLALLCLAAVAAQAPPEVAPQTRWEQRAQEKRELTRDVTWLTHEPLAFLLRRGNHFEDEPERYERMYQPENLRRMAAAGVRFGRLYFYKGFGLEYERANIERSKAAASLMHELGMKVSLYFAGTMFTETLYREVPEAQTWEQRDQYDHWVPYGIQTFRHYACPNEPAYREYLKRILKIGVEELHADEIAFDNLMLQPEPKSCRCERCIRAFHDTLRRKYPTEEAVMRRFGLPDVDWIVPNEWDSSAQPGSLTALNDPVLQEWVRFRAESLARHANDLSDYVKSLNPGVSIHFNIKGLYSFNRYWTNAVYHPLFRGHVNVMSFDTGGYEARLDEETGALVSQIRSYKMARRLDSSCDESLRDELRAAVHMAFGHQKPVAGYPGAPMLAYNTFTPILEFFREYNDRFYTGTDNVADVAVLRTWASMAYSINATSIPATLMEQVLIQHKIPFDLLFEEQIDRIPRYDAVILAGQESISRAQADALLDYVRSGGTLVLAGTTAQYNEWRERWRVNPLLPARSEGEGRIIHIPRIIPGELRSSQDQDAGQRQDPVASPQGTQRMSPSGWVLPGNHQEIRDAIVDGLPRGLSISTTAPLATVMELLTRPSTRETIAHFVNFDAENALAPFRATIRKQFSGQVKSVTCYSPDADEAAPVQFEESGEEIAFTVPATRLYSMIVVSQ